MKRILLYILLSFICLNIFAETYGTIYTPNGSAIAVTYYDEMSSEEITYYNNYTIQLFPNATLVGSSSTTYNCHSYAWNITEGGPTCWINASSSIYTYNTNNLSKYWTDRSYIETTEFNATKVFYYNSDHSAIVKASDRSKYISKWGAMPLMEHSPGYGPYPDMENRHYYKRYTPPATPEVITGTLSIGYGDLLCGHEYEFTQSQFNDEKYSYEWEIIDFDEEKDAISNGMATLEIKDFPHIAYITFLVRGLYYVNLKVYDSENNLVGIFTSQPHVL